MIYVLVEAAKNINNAAEENNKDRGDNVVELDQFKSVLNGYEQPLKELRDSL